MTRSKSDTFLTRVIFSKEYYILLAIIRSKKYSVLKNKIRNKLIIGGVNLPDKEKTTGKEQQEVWAHLDKNPLKFVDYIDNILSKFNIQRDSTPPDHYMYLFFSIQDNILFNTITPAEKPITPKFIPGKKNTPPELWIRIFPWTTKEDLIRYFKVINILKSKLDKNRKDTKTKRWTTFSRDFALYTLYQQVKKNIASGKLKKAVTNQGRSSKSPIQQMYQYKAYKSIKDGYGYFDDSSLEKLLNITAKRLGHINLI